MATNVLRMELGPRSARKIVGEIAEDSSKVFFTHHAESRMVERRITRSQVLRCLRHGVVIEGPYRDTHGSWKLNMEVASAGSVITVVVVLDWRESIGDYAIVITTYL